MLVRRAIGAALRRGCGTCAWAAVFAWAAAASAQTVSTWTGAGSDGNWGTGANWAGGTAPSGDNGNNVLVFAGSTRTSATNNLDNWSLGVGRLEFASGAGAFTLSGNTFGFRPYLGSGTQEIFQNSAATQTIGVAAFSFRNAANSQINLNAGDLVVTSPHVYIDRTSSTVRSLFITGTDSTRRTITFAGNVDNGDSGNDPDITILNNKRVLVTGSLNTGTGNDASVWVENGVLQFSGAGTMTGGQPLLGATSGSANAALWLDTAGTTFARQIELRGGSSGRRTIGGLNTSGTVTYSGNIVGGAEYDLAAATGGTVNLGGTRNFNANLYVNRPDGATTHGGTVTLSGATSSSGFTALHAGTLQISNFNQLGTDHFEFNATAGDSGTLRYSGGTTTTTKTLWIDNPGITRAAIDVEQAGTTLTWNPGSGAFTQNLTKTGAGWLSFGGSISGGTVGVEGGLLVLTASNSYAGGTTVTGGTVEVSAFSGEGGSTAGLGSGPVSVASGGQVTYWLSQFGTHTIANAFSLAGGTLYTQDGSNTFTGQITLASGASTIAAKYEDTISLSGGLTGSGNVLFIQTGGTGGWNAPTYVLSGTGANTGTVRVTGSSGSAVTTLQLANVNALQSATLDLATGDQGTVQFTVAGTNTYALGGLQGSRDLALGANSLSVGGNGQSTTYSGALSSSGLVTKVGSGTLAFAGSNSLTGGTTLSAGVLSLGSAGALGSSGTISFTGGTLQATAGNTADYSARFSNAAGQAYAIDTNGQNVSLASALTSSGGSLTKTGAGTLTLTGNNTFSGVTTVSSGTLAIGGGGTGGSLAGNIANGAAVVFDRSDTVTYAGVISGTGALTKQGAGLLTLTADNTSTGPTTVASGTLAIGGGGTTGALAGDIVNSGAVVFDRSNALSYGGLITGNGTLTKDGSGTLTLTGSSAYTGRTSILAGTLALANAGGIGASGTIAIAGGAILDVAGVTSGWSLLGGQTLAGNGTLTGNATAATLSVVAPGSSIGTLTSTDDFSLMGLLDIEISGNSIDLFDNSTGALSLSGATLAFTQLSPISGNNLVFAKYLSLSGTFASVTGLPSGYSIDYAYLGNSIALYSYSSIPELDPEGMRGVAALVGSVTGLLERSRLRRRRSGGGPAGRGRLG